MILISRHLTDYNFPLPEGCVIRINLAWENSPEKLKAHIEKIVNIERNEIFLDVPIGRNKPPSYQWRLEDIAIMANVDCVKYVAFSNVETDDVIYKYRFFLEGRNVTIVPKIESIRGVNNINKILDALPEEPQRTIMIDHDDLFTDMTKLDYDPSSLYTAFVDPLTEKCRDKNVRVLRTAGIVFTDE